MIVGYLVALMILSFSILSIPGQKYRTLTTSDSGWVYGIMREIEKTSAIPEIHPLSHAPDGWRILPQEVMQPMLGTIIYRVLHALNPSMTLMDVTIFFAPLMYSLTLIPVFLIARELKGDVAGCLAAFFMATLVSSIYWNKVGAFDREPSTTFFGAWFIFLMIKLFKADRNSIPIYVLLAGLSYGILSLTWHGSPYLLAVVIGATILVLIFRYFEKLASHLSDPLGVLEKTILENIWFIGSVAGVFLVITAIQWVGAGTDPTFWIGFAQTMLGHLGIRFGGEELSFPAYAAEAQRTSSWNEIFGKFYANGTLNALVILFMGISIFMFLWRRKNHELLMVGWMVILAGMVWPGVGQARFERQWWSFVAVAAGTGAACALLWIKNISFDPSWEWLKRLQTPLLITLLIVIFAGPYVLNAYANAQETRPPTEWRGVGVDAGLMETFAWIENENIPENTVFAIQWSFGHLFTGATNRPTVCDGVEGLGEEGVWENSPGVKPPDYIYRRVGNSLLIYGRDIPRKAWAVNGRRTDVQWFPRVARDELKWLLRTYRDNYGVRIDYIIFTVDQYWDAKELYKSSDLAPYFTWEERRLKAPQQLRPTQQDNRLIFDFGEERQRVVLEAGGAYVESGGRQLTMDGYSLFLVGRDGRTIGFGGFIPSPAVPQINEALTLFVDERNNIITAWLVKGTFGEVVRPGERIGEKAFITPVGSAIDGDESLVVAFSSSNQYVKVIRVNHDLL